MLFGEATHCKPKETNSSAEGGSRTLTPLRIRALKALVSAIPPPQQKDVRAVIITWVREKRKGIDIFPYICLTRFMTRFRPPLARLQRGKEGG